MRSGLEGVARSVSLARAPTVGNCCDECAEDNRWLLDHLSACAAVADFHLYLR